jgi:hypothetical protein
VTSFSIPRSSWARKVKCAACQHLTDSSAIHLRRAGLCWQRPPTRPFDSSIWWIFVACILQPTFTYFHFRLNGLCMPRCNPSRGLTCRALFGGRNILHPPMSASSPNSIVTGYHLSKPRISPIAQLASVVRSVRSALWVLRLCVAAREVRFDGVRDEDGDCGYLEK